MATYLDDPPVTLDLLPLGTTTTYPAPPGGRPPGYLPGGPTGPALPLPGSAPPANGNAPVTLITPELLTRGFLGLAATAAVVGVGYYLYKDHQAVTMARNAPPPEDEEDDDEES